MAQACAAALVSESHGSTHEYYTEYYTIDAVRSLSAQAWAIPRGTSL